MANTQTGRRRSPLFWLLFDLRGRISRGTYWLGYLFLVAVQSVVVAQIMGGTDASFHRIAIEVGPFVLFVSIYSTVAISVKRLHDMGYSGFLAIAVLIPVLNLAFAIWIGLLPGTAGPNPYGRAPDVAAR